MNNLPIVEKYRPTDLSEIVGNVYEIDKLNKFIKSNYIPNIIIEGEPGTGKTSAILCFVRKYLGSSYNENSIELNASDDRGIDIVRSKIKTFSQKINGSTKENIILKIVILDEADNMTSSAQLALRRIMELYEDTTRFVFTCNNIENIIDALQSRCNILHFGNIKKEDTLVRLKYISEQENIDISANGINAIHEICENKSDLRQMINILEFIKANADIMKKNIDKEIIYNICDKPSPYLVNKSLQNIISYNFNDALNILINLRNSGFSNIDISQTLFNQVKILPIDKEIILNCCEIIGKYLKIFLNKSDSEIQLASLLSELYLVFKN